MCKSFIVARFAVIVTILTCRAIVALQFRIAIVTMRKMLIVTLLAIVGSILTIGRILIPHILPTIGALDDTIWTIESAVNLDTIGRERATMLTFDMVRCRVYNRFHPYDRAKRRLHDNPTRKAAL
jgi:hypothetical protein